MTTRSATAAAPVSGTPRAANPSLSSLAAASGQIVRTGFAPAHAPDAVDQLAQALHPVADLDLVVLFVSPEADVAQVIASATERFGPAQVVGCTTAGEIGATGYTDGEIIAIGLPRSHFASRILRIEDLSAYDPQAMIDAMIQNRTEMTRTHAEWAGEFALLMVDGLSMREDTLTADLAPGLGPVPLFGGSAGDGTDFASTHVLFDGNARQNAAVVVQVRSSCGIRVFNTDHLRPTQQRMVVTGANPAQRQVHEINAEPAAREYARLLGKDPEQLTSFTFAAHPVVVRIGGKHHVRAIRKVADNGDLMFFSAIDEGVVLTLAQSQDMVGHLSTALNDLTRQQTPDIILTCDCVLRRIEAQQKQLSPQISALLASHRAVGFCTYGEQVNSMHVNQTLTGVAIYPPTEPTPTTAEEKAWSRA
ncbi:FIST N-terminal domain-containing protein [Phaeobacter italicus]|uniref:FIST N-terminal domain-containing protein n=1 Tax=Phaeobacter italicus TaxID=481446 RepID=UPI0035140800